MGRYDNVFFRYDAGKALVCLLQKGLSHTEEVNKLLGAFYPALWPETAPDAACHDDAVVILLLCIHGLVVFVVLINANIILLSDIIVFILKN